MALEKLKVVASGAEGNYWKSCEEAANKRTMSLVVKLCLFVNKDLSEKGAEPLFVKVLHFSNVSPDEMNGDRTKLIYEKIKGLKDADLDGAKDV